MAITVNVHNIKAARLYEHGTFSSCVITDENGNQFILFFNHDGHADRANAVAAAINGEAK